MDLSAKELLARDVFPAEVVTPDASVLLGVRAFATTHRLIVWAVENGVRRTLADVPLAEPGSVPRDRGSLTNGRIEARTAEGTYWINRAGGCGCGSLLKVLAPPVGWSG